MCQCYPNSIIQLFDRTCLKILSLDNLFHVFHISRNSRYFRYCQLFFFLSYNEENLRLETRGTRREMHFREHSLRVKLTRCSLIRNLRSRVESIRKHWNINETLHSIGFRRNLIWINLFMEHHNPLHSLIFFFLPSNNSLIQKGNTTNDYLVPIIIIITKI